MSDKEAEITQARWGTKAWIRENPYTKTDRKRRARIRKVLAGKLSEETESGILDAADKWFNGLAELVGKQGVTLSGGLRTKAAKARETLASLGKAVYDEVVGRMLAEAWGL